MFFAAFLANAGEGSAASSPASVVAVAAYAALNSGDAANAATLFTQAIESHELGPEALANAFLNRALASQKLGRSQNAIDDYTAALNLDAMPGDLRAKALYNRGLAQQKIGKPALAIEDFTSALLLDSGFSYAYLARANALRDNGQYLFSISDYERARKYHHPDLALVYYGEAQAFENLKRPAETKRLLQAALAVEPQFTLAADKLKAMGDVAELDDATRDPILTSSAATSPSGSTVVVKQMLPKAVEPPANLIATSTPAMDDIAIGSIDPVADNTSAAGSKVVVASVPKIPAQNKMPKALAPAPAPVVQAKPVDVASTEATAADAPANPAPIASGWVVQISSASSEEGAWSTWKAMQKRYKVLSDVQPDVVKAELGAKGTFYRVRMQGFEDQNSAQAACGRLKSAGVACFIAKANG